MSSGMGTVPPSSKPGGYGFDYTENGLWFSSPTEEELASKVADHRAANGIPIGDPLQDVKAFNLAKTKQVTYSSRSASLHERTIKWLESQLRVKPKYVDQEEADRRASICAQCPENILKWKSGPCKTCVQNADRATAIILMGRKQHPVGACNILSQNNIAAVYLDEPKVPNQSLPDFCWRREI